LAKKGRFITLEGGEGSGKSTQVASLAEALSSAGYDVVRTREPGGAEGAEVIRELLVSGATSRWDPVTEALLHYAARREHLTATVWPALDRGAWVVCDRFADSTEAYQGAGLGVAASVLSALYDSVVGAFKPDLTLILDLPVAAGLKRANARMAPDAGQAHAEDRYERMDLAFHEKLRQGFLDIAAREPDRCVVIDADRTVEAVQTDIWACVRDRFGLD
jgi:dTMP kinase